MKIFKILSIFMIVVSIVNCININNNNNNNNNNNKVSINFEVSSESGSGSGSESSYVSNYNLNRNNLVQQENNFKVGGNTPFNTKEQQAAAIFDNILTNEEEIYSNVDPSSVNFFLEKPFIDNESTVFKIIQNMPKGAVLHVHSDSSATYDYLINVGSYLPNCYYYISYDINDSALNNTFYFFEQQPADSNWKLLSTIRSTVSNVTQFDQELLDSLTMKYEDTGDYVLLWRKFQSIFGRVSGLVTYLPVGVGYYAHLCEQMVQDGVQHIELRKVFGTLYDIQGNTYDDQWFIGMIENLTTTIQEKYNMPEFRFKIIGCNVRHSNQSFILENMINALHLRNQYPKIFVGYDLVGAEDSGYTLYNFIDQFAEIKEMSTKFQYPLDFYFHAGETILYNNTNLYDAVLLQTKRIGHGIQLSKHPLLMDIVKKQNIGVEVCPISNQVLNYVGDMRSHPAFEMINEGIPVVISPDDPAIFGYGGLSYDFYEATYSWGLSLQQLKQLAINSINQAATFDSTEYNLLLNAWELKWSNFIDYIISNYSQNI